MKCSSSNVVSFSPLQNGALLPKGTYLNNDSSYTVCKEDGVLVTYLDASDESSLQHLHDDSMKITTAAVATPNNSSPVNCFTFEAQVHCFFW